MRLSSSVVATISVLKDILELPFKGYSNTASYCDSHELCFGVYPSDLSLFKVFYAN